MTAVRKELSRRRRPIVRWTPLIVIAVALMLALPAAASHPEVSLPGSNFEIDTDANLKVDDPAPSIDWANVSEDRKADLAPGPGDDSFGQGTKEDTAVPTVVNGSIPPNKSDLLNFGIYLETVGTDQFLHLFWHRVQEPQGTTNMDFEFNQSKTLSSNGVTPVRTSGDLLVQYDLSRGGTSPTLFLSRWIDGSEGKTAADCEASNSLPCWDKKVDLTAAGDATGSINTTAIPAAESDGLGDISARTFGEASLDFDALVGGADNCESFGSAYLKSRSSDSFNSELKDFIAPLNLTLNRCAQVIIRKQTDPEEDPNTTSFGFSKSFPTDPSSANTFSLTDDGVQDYGKTVVPGTGYTVTEDVIPAGWTLASVDCSASTGVTPNINGATVTFDIDASTDVLDCTYTNRARAQVIIRKQTDPEEDPNTTSFGFSKAFPTDPPSANTFSLMDDGVQDYGKTVLPGTGYTVTEDVIPAGWTLASVDCSASTGVTPNINGATVTFDLDPSDVLDCTYTNRTRGKIIVVKITDDGQGAFDFTSNTLTPSPFTLTTTGPGDAGKDSREFGDLVPGTYDVAETVPAGWNLVSETCVDEVKPDSTPAAIDLDPGDTVTCTFHDARERGAILITKTRKHAADGPGDHPHAGVDFVISGGSLASPQTITTDANGKACLDGLVLSSFAGVGDYTVHEVTPAGYDGEADKTVTVDNEATCSDVPYVGEEVSFHNTPLTNITVTVDSQVAGGTSSTIDCVPGGSAGPGDDISLSLNDRKPGTYTCTIVIDP